MGRNDLETLYKFFPTLDKALIDDVYNGFSQNLTESIKNLKRLVDDALGKDESSNNNNDSKSISKEKEEHSPRGYQLELAAIGEKQNAIAVLPTGAGKTYIAILLAKKIHEKQPTKKILFIVDRVNLVYQQAAAFEKFHSPLKIGKLHGDIVDKDYDAVMKCDIIVVIAQVVINLCEKKRFSLNDTSLLIFDEAHHTNKGHPYNRILQDFWFTSLPHKRPKIFGMTASPGGEITKQDTIKKIGQLCLNMNSTICVPTDQKELQEHVHKPELEVVKVDHSQDQDSLLSFFMDFVNQLINKLKELKFGDLPKSMDLPTLVTHFQTLSDQKVGKVEHQVLIWFIYECCKAATEMVDFSTVGVFPALQKAMSKLTEKWGTLPASKEISTFLINTLQSSSIFKAIRDKKYSDVHQLLISPKTKALMKVLQECVQQNKQTERLLFIVFVQTRKTAKFLKDYLLTTELKSFITPEIYVGHGGKKKVDEEHIRMQTKEQMEITRKFKSHEINMLIATSVAEEGLDVPSCNVVIRYDEASTVTSWVQSRGRARFKHSRFFILPYAKVDEKVKEFKTREFNMEQVILGITRNDFEFNKLTDALKDEKQRPFVEKDAINILQEFCMEKAKGCPTYFENDIGNAKIPQFQCDLVLPVGCGTGETIVGDARRSKGDARKSVAYKACVLLNNMGILNKFGDFYLVWRDKADKSGNSEEKVENLVEVNYVGQLNEICQKRGWPVPKYLEDGSGTSFTTTCLIRDEAKGKGTGNSKKEAKARAAKEALESFQLSSFL